MIDPTRAFVVLLSLRISSFMPRTSAHYSAYQVNPFNKKPYLIRNDLTMRHLLILAIACISLSSTAQVIDTTMTGNAMHMNLNLSKLDSTINAMQQLIEAQQAIIESLQAGSSFDGNYQSLSNLPSMGWVDLSYGIFSAENFSNANLSYANLAFTDCSNINLAYANLSYANLIGSTLDNADLSNANLSSSDIRNSSLVGANLSSADLSNTDLENTVFLNAILTDVIWTGAYYYDSVGCPCVDANADYYCD